MIIIPLFVSIGLWKNLNTIRLKAEAVDALDCQNGKIYVDCTLGGGGHSELILKGFHLMADLLLLI